MLFLDDVRAAPGEGWVNARHVVDAQTFIAARGMPSLASSDHDMGRGPGGYALARWMIEQDLDGPYPLPDAFRLIAHSRNPVGALNISALLTGYLALRRRG